jgi:hypothetical protein
MKQLSLILLVCTLSALAFAQRESSGNSAMDQAADRILVTNGCVSLTPNSQDFGTQAVDFPTAPKPFYLQNGCSVNLTVSNVNAQGQSFTQTNNCSGVLLPNNFCEIDVVFDPISSGAKNQTLLITYKKDGNPNAMQISAPLTGTGIHDMTFNPTSCDFGVVQDGDEGTCAITIQNQEPQRLTIDACNAGPFPFSEGTSCPMSLAKKGSDGDSATISLDFQPSGIGPYSGTFSVKTESPENGPGNPYTAPLTGVGMRVICKPPSCCPPSVPCPQ